MPIPVPSLDDRSFQDLVAEVASRIPAHTPEWTYPQPGDPGQTIIDLFAWLTDTLLYRVNLVPERQRLVFLRLLGIGMEPAVAARALISIGFDAPFTAPGAVVSQLLPPLTPIKGPVPFETLSEFTVLPITAEAYCKRVLNPAEATQMAPKIAELSRLYTINDPAVAYMTTAVFAGGNIEANGFDLVSASIDQALWFALYAPTPDPAMIAAVKAVLGQSPSGAQQQLNVGISPAVSIPNWDDTIGNQSPLPYVWELTSPDPNNAKKVLYTPLTVTADTTQGLQTDGIITLALPGSGSFYAPTNDVRADPDAGTGDMPPRLDDPTKSSRLVAWLRLRPTADLDSMALTWAGLNAVQIDQRQTTQGLVVGQANGQPNFSLQLPSGDIEVATFALEVEEAQRGFLPWAVVDDLATTDFQASAFELDPEAGTLSFGDGVHGRIPAQGARLRVAVMRAGGGAAGNLPFSTLTLPQPVVTPAARLKAWQPMPARGGQDAETLAEAELRIPALFRHRDRAVTAEDYSDIALATPGVSVGRADVLPGFKPQQRRSNVPGVVSVMALPVRTSLEAPYPRIDRPFVEAVYNQLYTRKPIGTELYVIGCEYVGIGLTVGVDNPGGLESVNTAVKAALQAFLFPLAPNGPSGEGWPLGRTVKQRELEVVVSRVDGVDGVDGPNIFLQQADGSWTPVKGANDNAEITLKAWQLPELIGVIVADGDAPADFKPPAPTKAQSGVGIPVVPEVC
jgi:predicted phage baseplate assembly protein